MNDLPSFSDADRTKINKLIYTNYTGDILTNIPACECGEITGEYNIGVLCNQCNTVVQQFFNQDLIPLTWIRAPNGVKDLINPMIWTQLKNLFTVSGFNVIQWICQDTYDNNGHQPVVLTAVKQISIEDRLLENNRGYNFFVDHFDEIIQKLMELEFYRNRNRDQIKSFKRYMGKYRNRFFSKYLPIPHRSLLVVEENDSGIYKESMTTGAIDAILTLTGIDTPSMEKSQRMKENRTVKTIQQISLYYENVYKNVFASKEGIYRKHVFSGRAHHTFRSVITSITDKHDHRDIYIPWGVAISLLRIHLANKLIRLDYTPNEALTFIDAYSRRYHPLIDQMFRELINDSPNGKGICALLNRNPSLHRASIQRVYITRIKTDIGDPTTSISILIVRGLNADFDGKRICCH